MHAANEVSAALREVDDAPNVVQVSVPQQLPGTRAAATSTTSTVDTSSGCIALGITGGRRVLGRNAAPYRTGRAAGPTVVVQG